MQILLSTILAASHNFYIFCLHSLLKFSNFLCDFLTHELFRRVLFIFQILGHFSTQLSLIGFKFHFVVVKEPTLMISVLLHLLRHALWTTVWSILVNVSCAIKKMCIWLLLGEIGSTCLIVFFRSSISLLIFSLLVIFKNKMLRL